MGRQSKPLLILFTLWLIGALADGIVGDAWTRTLDGMLPKLPAWAERVSWPSEFWWGAALVLLLWAAVVVSQRWFQGRARRTSAWLDVAAARRDYLPPETEEGLIEGARAADAAMDQRWETQTKLLAEPMNAALVLVAEQADADWKAAQSELERRQWTAINELKRMLCDGELRAKGVAVEGGIAQDEADIPQAYWRFLNLDWTTDSASHEGRRYIGIRIARVSPRRRRPVGCCP